MKNTVKRNEAQHRKIVAGSVKRVLMEGESPMNIDDIIDDACDALYAGDNEEALRLMKRAKQIHLSNGGDYHNWPGLTDDRDIHRDYPYGSL